MEKELNEEQKSLIAFSEKLSGMVKEELGPDHGILIILAKPATGKDAVNVAIASSTHLMGEQAFNYLQHCAKFTNGELREFLQQNPGALLSMLLHSASGQDNTHREMRDDLDKPSSTKVDEKGQLT